MSQRIFWSEIPDEQGRHGWKLPGTIRVVVTTGWDRPLQHHFLTVERQVDGEDLPLYCNMDDPALNTVMGGMTADMVIDKLEDLKIPYPEVLLHDLNDDKFHNRGNYIIKYGFDTPWSEADRQGRDN